MSEPISSQPAESNSQRIYLHVPYAQKDAAKQLGVEIIADEPIHS